MCCKHQAPMSDIPAVWAGWRPARGGLCWLCSTGEKSPMHLCSLTKKCSVMFVLVFISWRPVKLCECWTCAWLQSLMSVVLMLLQWIQYRATRIHSQHMHLHWWWISYTVYNNTSWRQNLTVCVCVRVCIYTVVYACAIFLASIL